METKFNFKSAICTSREQSERLLALGLKKETADCRHWAYTKDSKGNSIPKRNQRWFTRIGTDESAQVCGFMNATFIPAWSLHRLIEMMPKNIAIDGDTAYPLQIQKRSDGKWCVGYQGWYDCVGDLYDNLIWIYQLLISEGYLDEFCNKG